MVSYEGCLDYIENQRSSITWQEKYFSKPYLSVSTEGNIKLLECQKKFLKNLIEGKITDCPRNMGKTMVIKLYSEYLNYVVDMCKYDSDIIVDDYIDGNELVEAGLLSYKNIKEALYRNQEKAMKEYNISQEDLKQYVIPKEDLEKFSIGK